MSLQNFDIDQLSFLSTKFRQELEYLLIKRGISINTDINNPDSVFPDGACKLTSLIFGLLLINDFEIANVRLASGMNKYGSHIWLVVGNVIIDLTIDQYPEFGDASQYTYCLDSSDFHKSHKDVRYHNIELVKENIGYDVYTILRPIMIKLL